MEKKLTNREIGHRIKVSRGLKGLTLQKVADMVGVDRSTIQRYETGGIVLIKMPVLESICKALDVNPAWVLGDSEDRYVESDDVNISQEILDIVRKLSMFPQEKRKKIAEVLNQTIDLMKEE